MLKQWLEDPDRCLAVGRHLWMKTNCLPCPPYSVCDIGCGQGAGAMVQAIGKFDGNTIHWHHPECGLAFVGGLDGNAEFVEHTRELFPHGDWQVFDLESCRDGGHLPWENERWDCVMATEVMEHLPENAWPGVLREIRRIMRRCALFTIPDAGHDTDFHITGSGWDAHRYEPCFNTFAGLINNSFPEERVICGHIPGFFTAGVFRL